MSVWTTSLVSTQEVINMLLDKYRVECPASNFSLFVVKDNGGMNHLHSSPFTLFRNSCIVQLTLFLLYANREKKSKGGRVPTTVARNAGAG